GVLGRRREAGLSGPYPVQIRGTELLTEFSGTDDERGAVAAPRLQETTPDAGTVTRWAELLRGWVIDLARLGLVHGDLSPYNVLADSRQADPDPVIIDVPQVIDLIANPNGEEVLRRDCKTMCTWLRANGAPPALTDPEQWCAAARRSGPLRWARPRSAPSAEGPPAAPTGRLLRCGLGRRGRRRCGGPQLPPPLGRVVPVPGGREHGLEGVRTAVAVDALGEVLGVLPRGA